MKIDLKLVVFLECILLHTVLPFLLQDSNRDLHRCPSNLARTSRLFTYRQYCIEFVIGNHKSWSDARDQCHKRGGTLVTIPDASTQAFLMKALGWLQFDPASEGLWIGLNDRAHENKWKWDDGNSLHGYTHWGDGEPSALWHAAQDCIILHYKDHGRWWDQPCGWPFHYDFICQYDMLPTTTTKTTTTTTTTLPTTKTTHAPSTTTIKLTTSTTTQLLTTERCQDVDCQKSCPGGYSGLFVGNDGCVTCRCT